MDVYRADLIAIQKAQRLAGSQARCKLDGRFGHVEAEEGSASQWCRE